MLERELIEERQQPFESGYVEWVIQLITGTSFAFPADERARVDDRRHDDGFPAARTSAMLIAARDHARPADEPIRFSRPLHHVASRP
jgi:hypothetical protein